MTRDQQIKLSLGEKPTAALTKLRTQTIHILSYAERQGGVINEHDMG